MQQIIKSSLIGAMLVLLVSGACKKSDATTSTTTAGIATVSFTIDGDGYVSKNITITSSPSSLESASAYFNRWNFTSGRIGDRALETDEDKNRFTFYTDGKQTGQQKLGTNFGNTSGPFTFVSILLDLTGSSGVQKTYVYQDATFLGDPLPPGSSINITKYGGANDWIEGDFKGSLFNTGNQKIVNITNGHFKIPRGKDVK